MNTESQKPAPPSRKKLLIGGVIAIVAAAGIAIAFVLPAEFGIDPTGLGQLTGLSDINTPANSPELERGSKRKGVLTLLEQAPAAEAGSRDRWEFELGAYDSIEFKYTLSEGERMAFTWQSSRPLHYDLHAHPFEGGVELTESYGVGDAAIMHGRYVAPFTGIHGWYWQNRSLTSVKIVLDATGGFSTSTIFDSAGEHARPIVPIAE
ncbi:MAG TPA: hypothetical protein VK629_03860 [Steroidobacteraceae bacterium]|nr:hypothetical protein [Steroidobacteraceae bacterium]